MDAGFDISPMQEATLVQTAPPVAPWTVVTIARESVKVMQRFIAWHLAAGAERIVLYLDDKRDPFRRMVRHLPQVEVVRCTRGFWREIGTRPFRHFTHRQRFALGDGYARVTAGWVLMLDADELIHAPHRRIGEILAAQPEETRGLIAPTAERVRVAGLPEDGAFRLPIGRPLAGRVHGDFAPYVEDNSGLIGHFVGKSFTRARQEVGKAHPHWMLDPDGKRLIDGRLEGVHLLHFYENGYGDWRAKQSYRKEARARGKRALILDEVRRLDAAGDEEGLAAIYRRMHCLDEGQARLLRAARRLLTPDLGLEEKVATWFPSAA